MEKLQAQVKEFMVAAGQPVAQQPGDADVKDVKLGLALVAEEYMELAAALKSKKSAVEALVETADAIGDLLYVTTWLGLTLGLPLPAIMDEIQRSNMEKFGPGSRKDPETGKQLKPPGWVPPDLYAVLFPGGKA